MIFHSSFVQLVVDVDRGFNKLFQVVNNSSVAHEFVLYAFLESSSVYGIESIPFLYSHVYVFLESCSVLSSWYLLPKLLDYSFYSRLFVWDPEDTSDFSLEVVIVTEDIRRVFFVVIEFSYLRFYPSFCSSFYKGIGEYGFLVLWNFIKVEVRVQLYKPVVQTIAVSLVGLWFVDLNTIRATVNRRDTFLVTTISVLYLNFLSFWFWLLCCRAIARGRGLTLTWDRHPKGVQSVITTGWPRLLPRGIRVKGCLVLLEYL